MTARKDNPLDVAGGIRAFFSVAGVTISVRFPCNIGPFSLDPALGPFRIGAPTEDVIFIRHRIGIPEFSASARARPVYAHPPWHIFRARRGWVYSAPGLHSDFSRLAVFNAAHTRGGLFSQKGQGLRAGLDSLTNSPSDQILLARIFPDRQAVLLHAAGLVLNGHGLAFAGHSEAGKSTLASMLMADGQLLCDDRVVIRRWPGGFQVHGTWAHGDLPNVSPGGAPLRALCFLEKADTNELIRLEPREVVRQLPLFVIRPLVTADWWHKVLDVVAAVAREVPVYRLLFDRSGKVIDTVGALL